MDNIQDFLTFIEGEIQKRVIVYYLLLKILFVY